MVTNNEKKEYLAPMVKTILINPQNIICLSGDGNGNDPMEERDNGQYGDWGN